MLWIFEPLLSLLEMISYDNCLVSYTRKKWLAVVQ